MPIPGSSTLPTQILFGSNIHHRQLPKRFCIQDEYETSIVSKRMMDMNLDRVGLIAQHRECYVARFIVKITRNCLSGGVLLICLVDIDYSGSSYVWSWQVCAYNSLYRLCVIYRLVATTCVYRWMLVYVVK